MRENICNNKWIVGLACCFVLLFLVADTAAAAADTISQRIEYEAKGAAEVWLVWGGAEWAVLADELQPASTAIKDGVMHTPMQAEGDIFAVELPLPESQPILFGFLITKLADGRSVTIWDAGDEDGFWLAATEDTWHYQATLLAAAEGVLPLAGEPTPFTIRYDLPAAGKVHLVWGVDDWHLVPQAVRPPGTKVLDRLMYSPMQPNDDYHEIELRLPAGTAVNFIFQIAQADTGQAVDVWDTESVDTIGPLLVAPNGEVTVQPAGDVMSALRRARFGAGWLTASQFASLLLLLVGLVGISYQATHLSQPQQKVTLPFLHWLQKRALSLLVIGLTVGNLLMLAGTAVFVRFSRSYGENWEAAPTIKYLLVQFNLSRENVLASWYASMFILLIALAACLCFWLDYQRHRGRARSLSFGWLIVALLFAGLSLDEIGSLHERIGMITALNPFGDVPLGWVTLLAVPIGLVALFMVAFGWVHIRKNRWAFALFLLGVLLFVSVPFQEEIEIGLWQAAPDPDAWQRPIWQMLLEEGAELFAALSFLGATAVYARAAYQQLQTRYQSAPLSLLKIRLPNLLFGAVGLVGVLGIGLLGARWIVDNLTTGDDGITTHWFPSAVAFLLAVVSLALSHVIHSKKRVGRWVYMGASLLFLTLSAYFGAGLPFWLADLAETGPNLQPQIQWGLTALLLAGTGYWLLHIRSWWIQAMTVVAAALTVWALYLPDFGVIELPFWSMAAWVFALFFHLYYWHQGDSVAMKRKFKNFVYIRDLLVEMVRRDIKLRYKGSLLGVLWSLLNPLAQLVVFVFIFSIILPLDIPNYPVFVFGAILAWTWFQSSLYAAATAIIDGRSLIKRPGFPVIMLPIVTVMSNMIHYLLALPVLFLFLAITGTPFTLAILLLPLVIALQFCFTLALAFFVATFHVSFRDTQHLVGVFLMLLFYLTPIFYDASLVPAQFQAIYRLNPVMQLVEAYRAILLAGTVPAWQPMLALTAVSALLLYAGYTLFVRASYRFVEEL